MRLALGVSEGIVPTWMYVEAARDEPPDKWGGRSSEFVSNSTWSTTIGRIGDSSLARDEVRRWGELPVRGARGSCVAGTSRTEGGSGGSDKC